MKLRYKIPLLVIFVVFLASISIFVFLGLKHEKSLEGFFTEHMQLMARNIEISAEKFLTADPSDPIVYQKMNLTIEKTLQTLAKTHGIVYIALLDNKKHIIKLKIFEDKKILYSHKSKGRFDTERIRQDLLKRSVWFSSVYEFLVYQKELKIIKRKPSFFEAVSLRYHYIKHKGIKRRLPILNYTKAIQFSYSVSRNKRIRKTIGYVDIGVSKKYVSSLIRKDLQAFFLPSIIIFLIVVLLAIFLTLDIVMPIAKLEKGAHELAEGHLKYRLKIKRKDEFGDVSDTFNLMAKKLGKTLQELKDKYEEVNRLFKLATEDGLTKAFVHRFLMELLDKEIERSKRNNSYLSFIMTDIDHFKKFNDTYGHQTGDYVLEQVSKIFLDNVRQNIDIVGRYGGEEFGIILPDTDKQGAVETAEKLRKLVAAKKHKFKGNEFRVEISLGVSTIKAGSIKKETLVKWADKALYNSKETGRNKTSFMSGDKNV